MKTNTSSKPRAATTTGALVVVLRIRQDEDGDAMERIESVMKRSGLDAATVILRAIGLGLAGSARSDFGEHLWCDGVPGTIEVLQESRTYRVTVSPEWAALAARLAVRLSGLNGPNEKSFTAADIVRVSLDEGIFDLERHWLGTFNSWQSPMTDLSEQKPAGATAVPVPRPPVLRQ